MVDKSEAIKAMQKLEKELRKSGKNETADFFKKAIDTVKGEADTEKLKQFLEQICSSGAMSQYANFSYTEDMLFDDVYNKAKMLLINISK